MNPTQPTPPAFTSVEDLPWPVIALLSIGALGGVLLLCWKVSTPSSNSNSSASSTSAHITTINEVENRLKEKVRRGDTDYSDIRRDLKPLEEEARRRVEAVNRAPQERGYSLEVRREAAYRTLLQQGYSPSEARLTVDTMVERGMLPDPPRR